MKLSKIELAELIIITTHKINDIQREIIANKKYKNFNYFNERELELINEIHNKLYKEYKKRTR